MSYQFKNFKQLEKYLEKRIISSLDEIGDIVKQKLIDTVQDRLYDQYDPTNYKRTMEFINCISKTKVAKVYGRYVVEIYYDTSKMFPYIKDESWNAHADWYGTPTNELLPLWIEYGTAGSLWDRDGIYAIRDTLDFIKSEYNRLFRETLRYKGIDIV